MYTHVYIYIYIYTCIERERERERDTLRVSLGKGHLGSALRGSLQVSCLLTEGFRGTPVNLLVYDICTSDRAHLFPQSVKLSFFCSGPISVEPICPQPSLCARTLACAVVSHRVMMWCVIRVVAYHALLDCMCSSVVIACLHACMYQLMYHIPPSNPGAQPVFKRLIWENGSTPWEL